MPLQQLIQNLESKASYLVNNQCNDLCFMENCDNCKAGCLYQAGVLRSNAALLQIELPPVPRKLYLQTIKQLEER